VLASEVSRFGSEAKCRNYLEQLRWPDGVSCLRCGAGNSIARIEKRGQFECRGCGYQFSVRVGTVFQNSHLPLWKWLLAAYAMSESESGVSAHRIKGMLGVPYKTAWYLCHRIREAMRDPVGPARKPRPPDRLGHPTNISQKHRARYIDEIAFRSSNRGNPYRFRDILLGLVRAGSLPYSELTA